MPSFYNLNSISLIYLNKDIGDLRLIKIRFYDVLFYVSTNY